jgi:hypothetical protein
LDTFKIILVIPVWNDPDFASGLFDFGGEGFGKIFTYGNYPVSITKYSSFVAGINGS